MTVKDFIMQLNGIDSNTKKPRSAITVQLQMYNTVTEKNSVVESFSIHKPIVEVKRRGDYVEIEFAFDKATDIELRRIWNIYENYGRRMNLLEDKSINIPQLLTMIVPIKEEGKMYLLAFEPIMWVPKPKVPGLEANILSILFQINNMQFVDNHNIDLTDAKAEIMREDQANKNLDQG